METTNNNGANYEMVGTTVERELKLDVSLDFALPDLTAVVDHVTASELPHADLVATYFDTSDRLLLSRGITLRHRYDRADPGGERQWTLKLPGRVGGLALERNELSWSGESSEIPDEAIRLLRAIVRHAELVPIAELVTSRRRLELRTPSGERLAEIDVDTVAVMDDHEPAATFREVEVELEAEDRAVLDSVIARLTAAGARPGEAKPKVARALGFEANPPASRIARRRRRDMSLAEVIGAAVATGRDRLLDHDLGVRLSDDPEHVHQARVATRRLRSDLRTFADVLDPAWTARVRDELRWLGGALGKVRDADVLAIRLRTQAAEELTEDDLSGFADLKQRLLQQRQAAYAELLAVLDSERYIKLLDELTDSPQFRAGMEQELAMPANEAVVRFVRRPWKQLRRAVAELGDHPSDTQLHRIRIKAKRLRYSAEASAVAIGKPPRRLAKAAANLQDVLGAHHDAVTAESWLREAAAAIEASRACFVAGELVAIQRQEQKQLRQDWCAVWKSLDAKRLRSWLK
jgi:CHAD domain-containing protein